MRLWSISPSYLDRQGLLAVWREALQAQSVLLQGEYKKCEYCYKGYKWDGLWLHKCNKCKTKGKIKTPYYNHPQLNRFKQSKNPMGFIGAYLVQIAKEGILRGYKFKEEKIFRPLINKKLTVTTGQLEYEFKHLITKLINPKRDINKAIDNLKKTNIVYISTQNKEIKIIGELKNIQPHPLFKVVDGDIESWEKIK